MGGVFKYLRKIYKNEGVLFDRSPFLIKSIETYVQQMLIKPLLKIKDTAQNSIGLASTVNQQNLN